MSWHASDDPIPGDPLSCAAIDLVIVPRQRDLGGFHVRRALPSAKRQMVGPFIFWDQMGPSHFLPSTGLDVRPHPHIGLATVTYLFDGAITHKDSLGNDLDIQPGALNWMTAGRGIAHSERTPPSLRPGGSNLWGIQSWVALPGKDEETAPAFHHVGADKLPILTGEGKRVRVIGGEFLGVASPVSGTSPLVYADAELDAGARLPFDAIHEERAIYTVSGEIDIAGDVFGPGVLLGFKPGDRITITAKTPARLMVLGGEPMDGPRHIWWNFVSSRRERIEQAKEDWARARFDPVPDETEFIPLPG